MCSMADEERTRKSGFRSFVLGGLVGASAVVAGVRRERRRRARERRGPLGLAAFESAPCYREEAGGGSSSGPQIDSS